MAKRTTTRKATKATKSARKTTKTAPKKAAPRRAKTTRAPAMPQPNAIGLGHVWGITVAVRNAPDAAKWYAEALGGKPVNAMGEWWREIRFGEEPAAVVALISPHEELGSWAEHVREYIGKDSGIVFFTPDAAKLVRNLQDRGVKVDGPKVQDWGVEANFWDLDGNFFSAVQPTRRG